MNDGMLTDFDEVDEDNIINDIQDLQSHPFPETSNHSGSAAERLVRKRSSKACDNCRKAKCKCERTAPNEPCKTCVINNQECTFLGPSRKRGPPKGYIDALESKLHQMEALFGSIIASHDTRARSLIFDLSQNPLAREVIQRVDESPFGEKGRNKAQSQAAAAQSSSGGRRRDNIRSHGGAGSPTFLADGSGGDGQGGAFGYTPLDWQTELIELIHSRPHERQQQPTGNSAFGSAGALVDAQSKPGSSSSGSGSGSGLGGPLDMTFAYIRDINSRHTHPTYSFNESNPHQRRRLDRTDSPFSNATTNDGFFGGDGDGAMHPGGGLAAPTPSRVVPSQSHLTHHKSLDHINFDINGRASGSGSKSQGQVRPAPSGRSLSTFDNRVNAMSRSRLSLSYNNSQANTPYDSDSSGDGSSDLADAVGQLSINELHQVRYHGKASGLHLLMPAMEKDHGETTDDGANSGADSESSLSNNTLITPSPGGGRDEGASRGRVKKGIWKFPAAGVWPPVIPTTTTVSLDGVRASPSSPSALFSFNTKTRKMEEEQKWDMDASQYLPSRERQHEFVTLYFAYVHPFIPILHKSQFMRDFGIIADMNHPEYLNSRERVSNLLLLGMFAVAARYSNEGTLPDGETMWTAGDVYNEHAMNLIGRARASSHIDTVQVLLLNCYRDVGLGMMERAWLNSGMAVRVAQDLGLHRSIVKWSKAGQLKFTEAEKHVRCRVWHSCLKLDRYVATYIGRPTMVSESDYDTPFPQPIEEEEEELWVNVDSHPAGISAEHGELPNAVAYVPQPSRVIMCFNASRSISRFTGMIASNFYSIRSPPSSVRREARHVIERKMEKFYNELDEPMKYSPSGRVPPPHVLSIHMQFCLNTSSNRSSASTSSMETDERVRKALAACQKAAHRITDIGTTFMQTFCPRRAPSILSYYLFTASIMHVTSLMDNPSDVQARIGLQKAKAILKSISVVWPSALRAWELLDGVKAEILTPDAVAVANVPDRRKRPLVDTDSPSHTSVQIGPISAQPITTTTNSIRSMRHSPTERARRRSVSSSDRLRAQPFRMEPLQLAQVPSYPQSRSPHEAAALPGGGVSGDGLGLMKASQSQMLGENPSNHSIAQQQQQQPRGQSLHPFHPSLPVHRPWVLSDAASPYHTEQPQAPRQDQHQQPHMSDEMQAQPDLISSHNVHYDGGHYVSTDYQRQPVESFFPNISSSTRSSSSVHHPASPFQELFQPSDMSTDGSQGYVNSRPPNRGVWNGYTVNESYGESSTLPGVYAPPLHGGRPAPSSESMSQSTNMLPPMMLPVDNFARSMQASSVPVVDQESYSGLASYFNQTGGTSSAFISGPPEDPSHQSSIDVLLAMGITSDVQQVRALLEKHHWDANAAATDLLSDPTPTPQLAITYPESAPPSAAPPTWTGAHEQTANLSAYEQSRSTDTSIPRGALNSPTSRTFVPPRVVAPSNLKKSDTYIDLTGEDDEEALRKAVAASLEGTQNHKPEGVVIGPKNRGDTTPLQQTRGISHEDQLLSQALEASLTTSINADVYPEISPWDNRRHLGSPVAARTKSLNHVHVALLMQALFAVPQLSEAVARWRRNRDEESMPGILDNPLLSDTHQAYRTMETLQKIFALLDHSSQASENIDLAIESLPPLGLLHPNSPGDDMKGIYDNGIALLCEVVMAHHDMQAKTGGEHDNELQPRLVLSRTGYEEKDILEPPGIDTTVRGSDLGTLEVITASAATEANTLESAIFNHLLKPPIKSFIVRWAPVLAIRVNRFDLNSATPLTFPKRLFLDPFLWENRDLVLSKVQEIEHAQENIEKIGKISQQFSSREDRDPVGDLKQTICYLENVADARGDEKRAKHLESMAGKLKGALAQIQQELENCSKQMVELRDGATTLLNIPELQTYPYDLRAVLVHDGLVGRKHSYAYLRDWSGEWFKSCDAVVTHVPEDTVLSDAAGLHLNAGPYLFLYSEVLPDCQEAPSLDWPQEILNDIAAHNKAFQMELSTSNDMVGRVKPVDTVMSVDASDTESGHASHGSSRLPSPGTSPQVSWLSGAVAVAVTAYTAKIAWGQYGVAQEPLSQAPPKPEQDSIPKSENQDETSESNLDSHIPRSNAASRHNSMQTNLKQPFGANKLLQLKETLLQNQSLTPFTQAFYDSQQAGRRWEVSNAYIDTCSLIAHCRTALELCPTEHPGRSDILINLSGALNSRYKQMGDLIDLANSIGYGREALSLCPHGHPDRGLNLTNLSAAMDLRYRQTGDLNDLVESVGHSREALSLHPTGHPNRSHTLGNLSVSLISRYVRTGDLHDLTESIDHGRESLSLRPDGHPGRSLTLSNLSAALDWRYRLTGDLADLTESIIHSHEALSLRPDGHTDRGFTLRNLSVSLELTNDVEDLAECVGYAREALSLHPSGHPDRAFTLSSLSSALGSRYRRMGDVNDLTESICHDQEVLSLCLDSHPYRGSALSNLSVDLDERYKQTGNMMDLIDCIAYLKEAVTHSFSPLSVRFHAANRWIFIARNHNLASLTEAYSSALAVLDRSILSTRSIHDRHARLTFSNLKLIGKNIAADAASWAIEKQDLELAVQVLEQGRGIMFNQLQNYRTPLDELEEVNEKLANHFRTLSFRIEICALSNNTGNNDETASEDAVATYQKLASEWDQTVEEIRSLRGFESFLQVTPFTTLRKAAASGPVILVNISQYRSDAIIVLADSKPLSIPLQEATPSVIEALALTLKQAVSAGLGDDESNQLIKSILQKIWHVISEPIVLLLQNALKLAMGSRIWWVPTSNACSLPIHASGPYLAGQKNLPDLFISSYAPTLSSLTRAHSGPLSVKSTFRPRLLVAAQAEAEGETELPNVNREITAIIQQAANVTVLEGERCTRDAVLAGLKKAEWVHFACHGHQHRTEPFKSHFSLRECDAPLTLLDIISNGLPNAELAVLSACHSAAGDKTTPDEAIHMAAGMLFAGFRSVVGTMWAMDDRDGPVMAEAFYKYMFRNGRSEVVDCRDAAKALVMGVRELRRRKVPMERWINFVHYGI
ncbi:hypothetical protein FRB98_005735 [Tulasnella sp. 332]|nr:hypothetical protein FRB98_005735 [Tulasnella sp. 332]